MIARIPAALLPLLSPLRIYVGRPGSRAVVMIQAPRGRGNAVGAGARAVFVGISADDAGDAVCTSGGVGAFKVGTGCLYVDTLLPTARDMLSRAIADHLGVPGDGPAATERGPDGGWRIARFSFLFDSAPLPIPADTPGAEVIGRAMAALWPDTP